jgi:hypothetical protein
VQTFFLAEQPNGYFVLNDIFRFLKEETVEGDDSSEPEPEAVSVASTAPVSVPEPVSDPLPPPAAPSVSESVATPSPVEEPSASVIPEPVTSTPAPEPIPQKINGVHTDTPEPKLEPAASPAPPVEPRASTPEPVATTPAPTPAPGVALPAPAPTSQPAPSPPAATAPPPQPAPAAPKTWANLAAANSQKWGAAVAQESRGTTEVPVSPAASVAGTQSPAAHHPHLPNNNTRGNIGGRDGGGVHPAVQAALSVTTAQCFVKGVTEPITQTQLTNTLTQRFGPIKDQAEIVRSKACAFLEFQNLDAAKRAIIACLPVGQGGEGGVRVDVGGEVGSIRILVETRKERGDRPVSRPRGGAPVNGNGEARGGFRGRGGAGGGGGGSGGGGGGGGRGRPTNSK